ncbi:oxamate carbamoyltransferase subunit AllG family protein [Alcaligenes faecalis]|uniref:oxamate carbamoyltransferase subunit AllG family protein n=1 Tax=Alcaligenes faecalis TaxID=511 RepID=UPI0034D5B280
MAQHVETQAVMPAWTGVRSLQSILPSQGRLVLHAGPPFRDAQELPAAIRNSALIGILYEGWADNKQEAQALLEAGGVQLAPAQDYGVVVPLAGVVTPSMYLIEVSDSNRPGSKKYSVLNEGMQWCTRLGIFADEMVPHLRWLHQDLGARLAAQFQGPVDLAPIVQASLLNGDDGHARTMHGSRQLADIIVSWGINDEASQNFLYGAMAWALNYWMAASALILANQTPADGVDAIVKVGGNGLRFGLQLASSTTWLITDAPVIAGNKEPGNEQAQALGALGDSAVVDFVGLGGQCLDLAGISARNLHAFLPSDYLTRQGQFLKTRLPFLAGRNGISDFAQVIANNTGPLVLLGMIDGAGERGRVGGGVATVDASLLQALKEWQYETTVV